MPTPPQRGPYPKTPEEAASSQWAGVHRLHGAGETQALFKGAPKTVSPWPSAGRTKSNSRGYDPARLNAAMQDPSAHMRQMDPRNLHATQPWVTKAGTDYYMCDTYRQTGRTFADMNQATNRFPVVYTDVQGRNKLLSGHHRATAALLRGEQFHALHVTEED
jgi:hypothetical protein